MGRKYLGKEHHKEYQKRYRETEHLGNCFKCNKKAMLIRANVGNSRSMWICLECEREQKTKGWKGNAFTGKRGARTIFPIKHGKTGLGTTGYYNRIIIPKPKIIKPKESQIAKPILNKHKIHPKCQIPWCNVRRAYRSELDIGKKKPMMTCDFHYNCYRTNIEGLKHRMNRRHWNPRKAVS